MNRFLVGVSLAAVLMPASAWAQSTGSQEFEDEVAEEEVVVTGRRTQEVGGVQVPDATKSRVVLTEELIRRQVPGQTINDVINLIPSVSFQNNDPYGSSGGTLNIRGFGADRISQTFDGVPLNDTGNYAIYSNQQLDPELIEQVNVNLGTTDVDSPTASAVGGTVNYRTRIPGRELAPMAIASIGEYGFRRVFGMVDVGEFTPFGTRGFVSASRAVNNNPFNGFGRIRKQQYNARLYQDVGEGGDFISLSGHYNQNRNNFGGSVPLRTDLFTTPGNPNSGARVVGSGTGNRFPLTRDERFYGRVIGPDGLTTGQRLDTCTLDAPQAGVADAPNTCGTEFDRRFNPSNTGNIRGASRFTLADNLTLYVDPSYQYVKANGGGTVTGIEAGTALASLPNAPRAPGQTFFGSLNPGSLSGTGANRTLNPAGGFGVFVGQDLNGDGDLLDRVTLLGPSQTQTHRYGLISSLAYDINDQHRVRVAYTFDRGRHRQTGQLGFLNGTGDPRDVFPVNDPITAPNGEQINRRDRLSYAILHQVGAQYRGRFFDERLTTEVGLRAPFFTRELNQNCFVTAANGNVGCVAGDDAAIAAFAAANPQSVTTNPTTGVTTVTGFAAPQSRTYKYDALLPNVGFTYNFTPGASVFASYAKGISVPGTDPLYASLFFPEGTASARPDPERTDNFDLGFRYRTGRIQAQVSGFFNKYKDRLATAFDFETGETIFRNLGEVDKYGVDGSVAYAPNPNLLMYVFGSLLDSEIKQEIQTRTGFIATRGKREAGAPTYTLGARVQGTLGPVELGIQAKRTGKRFLNDENVAPVSSGVAVYSAATPAYTLVDLDARFSLRQIGLEQSYIQLNVFNLFDELYAGGFGGTSDRNSVPFVQIGAPRAISASFVLGL